MFSYAGKILHVNLESGRIWVERLSEKLCREFIGARGVNVKLWWDLVRRPNIDPLSP